MTHQLVSIIIPTRNRAETLKMCLQHIARITYPSYEIIVVDSSSDKKTMEIMKEYPRIKYVPFLHNKDKMPQARNLGIKNAAGEFVAFIDDDCMVHPDWLDNVLPHFQDPSVGAVGGRVFNKRLYTEPVYNGKYVGEILSTGEVISNWMIDTLKPIAVKHLPGGNNVIRKNIFKKLGGFDGGYTGGNYLEETDMFVRIGQAGFTIIYEPRCVVDHLQVPREDKGRETTDTRIHFYVIRNLVYFYIKNYGFTSEIFRNFLKSNNRNSLLLYIRSSLKYALLAILNVLGKLVGIFAGIQYLLSKLFSREKGLL